MSIFAKIRKLLLLIIPLFVLSLIANIVLVALFLSENSKDEAIEEVQQEEEFVPRFVKEREVVFKEVQDACPPTPSLTTNAMLICLNDEIEFLNTQIEEQNYYMENQRKQGREGTEADKQEFLKRLEEALKQSNKDRDAYIDNYCSFESYEYYGGTLQGVTYLDCKKNILIDNLTYIRLKVAANRWDIP